MDISIVIPSFNEQGRIIKSVSTIKEYLDKKKYSYEIIVSDDGSLDDTARLINKTKFDRVKVISNIHKGKGFAVKEGVQQARGNIILFTDADLSTPIDEMEKLICCLKNGYDIAFGSRNVCGSNIEVHQSWIRENMGKIFNVLVRTFILKNIKDTQCGFKCFKKEAAQSLFRKQKIEGFAFDVEILYLAKKSGYKIQEVPVRWINMPGSKVNPMIDSIKTLLDLIWIKIIHFRNKNKITQH